MRVAIYQRSCGYCKSSFELNPRLGLNWANKTGKGKYCSRKCAGLSRRGTHNSPKTEFKRTKTFNDWNKHHRFIDGIWSYQRWKKNQCEDCGSIKYLVVHHLDHDRHNNEIHNLRTVCAKCHCNTYHPRKFYGNQYV